MCASLMSLKASKEVLFLMVQNKMEFSFGDEYKGGPLALGMHKRGSFYDIVNTPQCHIVHEDFRKILTATLEYFTEIGMGYYRSYSMKDI